MKENILILTPMKFYCPEDENLFFSWLDKIECVESYEGIAKELLVSIKPRHITFNEYRNLYGIFKRFKLKNQEQLKDLFETKDNKDWF